MKNECYILFVLSFFYQIATAQIGYQVSLLNNATGEPRANESVNVVVRISDSYGGVIYEQNKQETTNDFGVLSMTVGDSGTFQNVDWSKLPFFIEASVDGRLIGKSQILSVPVAEYAKQTGVLTKELLCSKTWSYECYHEGGGYEKWTVDFYDDGSFVEYYVNDDPYDNPDETRKARGQVEIEGNFVFLYYDGKEQDGMLLRYSPKRNDLMRVYSNFGLK